MTTPRAHCPTWMPTDKARMLFGSGPAPTVATVGVPLLDLPWRDEARDRRRGVVQVTVHPPDLDAIRAEGYHAGLRDGRQRR